MENNKQLITGISDKQLIGYLDAMGLAQKLTEKEKTQFLEISKAFGLNPFKREIHVSKYNQEGPMSIIVGYETYIKRAERSGQLDGWQVVTEGNVKDETLKAIITIHRKDRKIPFVHEVYYSEYVGKTNAGAVTKFWQKAFTMTKKVAMAQGFRLCFADELGGMPYTNEEEGRTEDIAHEDVTANHIAEMTADTAIETDVKLLRSADSLEMLAEFWGTISKGNRKDANIIAVKEEMKVKLTEDKTPATT